MKFLSRIPFWQWLLILTVLCYAVWNPFGVHLIHWMTKPGGPSPGGILISVITVMVFSLFINATYRSLGNKGLVAYLILVASTLYFLHSIGIWDSVGALKPFVPFLIALLLAIGSQSSKIYRAITGRVSVEDNDTVHPDDHDVE
jgi:hypothetical protein